MVLPNTLRKIVNLDDTRNLRRTDQHKKLQLRLANSRRAIAILVFGIAGAKAEISDQTTAIQRCKTLLRYIDGWQHKLTVEERRAAKLVAGLELLETRGALL